MLRAKDQRAYCEIGFLANIRSYTQIVPLMWLTTHELKKNAIDIDHAKVIKRIPGMPQTYKRNNRQLRIAESGRNGLPQGKEHELITQN